MKPTPGHTADTLTHIEQLAAHLRILEPVLRHRADTGNTLDGYPPTSLGGGGTNHGGDPVGAVVALRVDRPHHDLFAHTHHDVLAKIDQARRLLEQAVSAGRNALPPSIGTDLDDGCVSCSRIHTWSPIHRTRRCRWCSDWAYDHDGDDPPAELLRAHHEGRRITTRLVEKVTGRRSR